MGKKKLISNSFVPLLMFPSLSDLFPFEFKLNFPETCNSFVSRYVILVEAFLLKSIWDYILCCGIRYTISICCLILRPFSSQKNQYESRIFTMKDNKVWSKFKEVRKETLLSVSFAWNLHISCLVFSLVLVTLIG